MTVKLMTEARRRKINSHFCDVIKGKNSGELDSLFHIAY